MQASYQTRLENGRGRGGEEGMGWLGEGEETGTPLILTEQVGEVLQEVLRVCTSLHCSVVSGLLLCNMGSYRCTLTKPVLSGCHLSPCSGRLPQSQYCPGCHLSPCSGS